MAVTGKILNHVLKKFMKAEVAKRLGFRVELPNGELYDIKEVQLLENVIIGDGESHQIGVQM
jgi:hypothetical protein